MPVDTPPTRIKALAVFHNVFGTAWPDFGLRHRRPPIRAPDPPGTGARIPNHSRSSESNRDAFQFDSHSKAFSVKVAVINGGTEECSWTAGTTVTGFGKGGFAAKDVVDPKKEVWGRGCLLSAWPSGNLHPRHPYA